jgi:hypothetical protein
LSVYGSQFTVSHLKKSLESDLTGTTRPGLIRAQRTKES